MKKYIYIYKKYLKKKKKQSPLILLSCLNVAGGCHWVEWVMYVGSLSPGRATLDMKAIPLCPAKAKQTHEANKSVYKYKIFSSFISSLVINISNSANDIIFFQISCHWIHTRKFHSCGTRQLGELSVLLLATCGISR